MESMSILMMKKNVNSVDKLDMDRDAPLVLRKNINMEVEKTNVGGVEIQHPVMDAFIPQVDIMKNNII
jgi:hypothetical protein